MSGRSMEGKLLKILQVITLFTPNGDFGGPARVAINQTRSLRARGIDVSLVGGSRELPRGTRQIIDGVSVRSFGSVRFGPKAKFAAVSSPRLMIWLIANLRQADIIHVHLSRDLVSLPAAVLVLMFSKRLVVQPHGTIGPSTNPIARMLDELVTLRILRRAACVFYLSEQELDNLRMLKGSFHFRLSKLANGMPEANQAPKNDANGAPDVLFLARLNTRKRPDQFLEMAKVLSLAHPEVTFSLVGPDGGMGSQITRMIGEQTSAPLIRWEGALDPSQTLSRMSRSSIYVLPALDEPFGMTVLEALSCGKPVVITDSCALAPFVIENNCGLVYDGTLSQLVEAVSRLLDNPGEAEAMGRRGATAVANTYSMSEIAALLEAKYEEINELPTPRNLFTTSGTSK